MLHEARVRLMIMFKKRHVLDVIVQTEKLRAEVRLEQERQATLFRKFPSTSLGLIRFAY